MIKKIIFWLIISIIIIFTFNNIIKKKNIPIINYSNFLSDIENNKIKKIKINGKKINVLTTNNNKYYTYIPIYDNNLLKNIIKKNIILNTTPLEEQNIISSTMISWFPIIIIITLWVFLIKKIYKNGNNSFIFNKSKAKISKKKNNIILFKDIAGCDEAKEEVKEIVEYLKKPKKFKKLGGKLPKGILMIGPPGTGKTLLAKAIASEAKVPFYNISGSDFVEMFVGVGASRVRDMFNKAKKNLPCIIFIDEIDAIGRKRSNYINNGNDEREQTLNQILVEMDGFDKNKGIIIIGATNRPDILDPALMRPGRFDRKVIIDLPDIKGRKQIIKIHTKNIPLNKDINFNIIAKSTPGFSGADLSNLVNESALLAAKNNKKNISMKEFEISKDKIIMGTERKSLIMTKKQKELSAYHESGHTIIGELLSEHDPVHKVTIIPRGKTLGLTFFLPKGNEISISKKKLESKICTLYGGRLAEEIIYGEENISIGSSNDIKIATTIAKNMITKWGYSNKIGPILLEKNNNNYYINQNNIEISNYTLKIIEQEIKKIIKKNYLKAKKILLDNINILHTMKDQLIKYETLNRKQIKKIIFYNKNINNK